MNYSATSTPSSGYKISSTGGDQYHQVHGSRVITRTKYLYLSPTMDLCKDCSQCMKLNLFYCCQAVDSLSKFENSNASTTMSGVSLHQSVVNNPAAVLGLTSTTNALSGKVSATTAGKDRKFC